MSNPTFGKPENTFGATTEGVTSVTAEDVASVTSTPVTVPDITPPPSPMWSKAWWLGMGERVVTTFAFTLGAVLLADGFIPGVSDGGGIHWLNDVEIAALGAGFSLLKAIATPGFTAGK